MTMPCLSLTSAFFIQAAETGDEFDALQAPHPFIRPKDGHFHNEIVTFLKRLPFLNDTVAFPLRRSLSQ
jgi:hypothetical protein